MDRGMQALGRIVLAFGRVQLEAPVLQAFPEGLRGLVGTTYGPIVKIEGRHVHKAVGGFDLCSLV